MVHSVDASEGVVGLIVVATLVAIIAAVTPVTAAQAHYERERQLALRAQHDAEAAVAQAQAAVEKVEQLEHDVQEQNRQLSNARSRLNGAQTDADRRVAQPILDKLLHQKLELDQRIGARRLAAEKARTTCLHISKECLDNPLAKGCQ